MKTVKKRSQIQEKSVAKDMGAKTVVASGAMCITVGSCDDIVVDKEDLPLLSRYYLKMSSDNRYVIAREPMYNGIRKSVTLGRLLLGVTDPKVLVDHRDRNTHNYSKSNLRCCSRSENQSNRVMNVKKTSKYRGVNFDKQLERWKVSIKVNNKKIHGGYFYDEDEAGLAYNELALKYFGEFAILNEVINNG
jgi:hypothetical protein